MSEQYLFLGDSITCADRLWDNDHHGLGYGYVYNIHQALSQSKMDIMIINKGFDALTCNGLMERLYDGRIVLSQYDKIVILIGINDVGVSMNTGTDLLAQGFSDTYQKLLLHLKAHAQKVLCLSPFLFPEPKEYLTWYPELHYALEAISVICNKHQIPFYSLQEYFQVCQTKYLTSDLTPDGIHLTEKGHRLLADFILTLL